MTGVLLKLPAAEPKQWWGINGCDMSTGKADISNKAAVQKTAVTVLDHG